MFLTLDLCCTVVVTGKAVNRGDGKGMQVPCTLHSKGHKKSIGHFEQGVERHSLDWTDTFSLMQRKTEYTAASKYIQCFGLQPTVFLTCHARTY